MPTYFFDSSALVKRYQFEQGTVRLAELLDSPARFVVARLTKLEVSAAIVRRGNATRLPTSLLTSALSMLDRDFLQSFDVVELDPPLLDRAVELTRRHGLRAADAIQLACALFVVDDTVPQEFTLVGSDQELNAAAVVEGLVVLDLTQS